MRLVRPETFAALVVGVALSAFLTTDVGAAGPETGSVAGIQWSVPGTWTKGTGSSMRVATYGVPGAGGAEDGECAVFYFGRGQGGGVDENVARWARQFEENPEPAREERTVSGVSVTLVDLSGTYMDPGGSRMQSRGAKPDYRLLGAIVEAPGGRVFFKLTGPGATIAEAHSGFDAMIGSIEKQ